MFAARHEIDGDALQKSPRKATIEEIADRKVLDDGHRKVEILRVDNPHADGLLVAYVPDAKLGYVVDIWSPGRDKLSDKPTPGQAALVAAVAKFSSTPERFAGGHGSVAGVAERFLALPAAAAVEREVGGDAVQPGREGRPPAESGKRDVRAQEGLLRDVPGLVAVLHHAEGEAVDARLVFLDQLFECPGVALPRCEGESGVVGTGRATAAGKG